MWCAYECGEQCQVSTDEAHGFGGGQTSVDNLGVDGALARLASDDASDVSEEVEDISSHLEFGAVSFGGSEHGRTEIVVGDDVVVGGGDVEQRGDFAETEDGDRAGAGIEDTEVDLRQDAGEPGSAAEVNGCDDVVVR